MTTKDNNELDEILEQAFTDVASDTIWQDNRRVEIFATAKKALLSWHNKEVERIIGENPLANDDDAKYNFPEHYNEINNRHELSVEQRNRAKGEK